MSLHWAVDVALATAPVDAGFACGGWQISNGIPDKDAVDVDTEVPTDSESCDSSDTPMTALQSDAWTVSSEVAYQARALDSEPLWLSVLDGRLQVVQADGKVKAVASEPTLQPSVSLRPVRSTDEVAKKRSPLRPPGVFFAGPPGLGPPKAAVTKPAFPQAAAGTKPVQPMHLKGLARTRTLTPNSVIWAVDARKLNSSDKVIVSPRFQFEAATGPTPFRVLIYPKEVSYRAGTVSFKRSRGLCTIQLKSEISLPGDVCIDVRVGQSGCSGPVVHDFSETGVCRLPDTWHFGKEIDATMDAVEVYVSIYQAR